MGKLDGKVAIITGAARGIGAAAARIFVQEGARVVLVDVLEQPLKALVQELGERAMFRITDITDETAVSQLVDETVRQHGHLDIALLNAGIAGDIMPLTDYPTEVFDKVMAVNVRGVWLGLKYAMKAMASTGGSIVITASTAGIRATPNMPAYTASKHAAIGLMRAAAIEGAAQGIRVNTVNPATIDTPMVAALSGPGDGQSMQQHQARHIPIGRIGKPEEVARMMLFLASDDSSYCTGGIYMVDGGISAGRAA